MFLLRVVFDAEDASAVLAVAREALAAVIERVGAWPDDDVWPEVLPAEFVERCEPEEPEQDAGPQAVAEWTAWWQGLSAEEKAAACAGPWRLSDWLFYFDPTEEGQGDDRSWWWWDAGVDASGGGWVDVATTGWPFGSGSLYWLIEAGGGRNPRLVSPG
ncbi:hypothetical protein [Actinomadura macrotermitis]|uniref:Uncharacterized protein n=1 Tax=Actinomadura macrotermitis TaxID=2585200 RepID=A0A7K0C1J5_9ACTN|nr:hypothetical protein [Actinomadura macrotermitis]MQY07270.1 hypothetical protein [Actinomadura macrotermitis]